MQYVCVCVRGPGKGVCGGGAGTCVCVCLSVWQVNGQQSINNGALRVLLFKWPFIA